MEIKNQKTLKLIFSRTYLKYLLKIFFGFFLVAFISFKVDLMVALKEIYTLPSIIIILSILIYFFSIWLSSFKWHILLPNQKILYLLKLNLITQYFILIFPGQFFVEGAKGFLLIKEKNNSKNVFASIVVDKITGLIALVVLSLLGMLFSSYSIAETYIFTFTAFFLICFGLLFAMNNQEVLVIMRYIFDKMYRVDIPKLKTFLTQLKKVLEDWREYLNKPSIIILSIAIGILYQITLVLLIFVLARGIKISLSIIDFAWIFGITSVIILLPLTIGGLGIREITLIGLLGTVGVSEEKSLALSLSIFAFQIIGSISGGIIAFAMSGSSSSSASIEKNKHNS